MRWIKNGAPAGLYAINATNKPVQIYIDLWKKTGNWQEDRTFVVSLVPAYFPRAVRKYEYYKSKKTLYFRLQYYNEKLDASPQWQGEKKEEDEAKRIIAEYNNTVSGLEPLVERKKSLGELTGNVIERVENINGVKKTKRYAEIYYVVQGEYMYYFKKDVVTYVRFSTTKVEDVKSMDAAGSRLLYRGDYYLQRYSANSKQEGGIKPNTSGTEYFGFNRKANEKWRRRWLCLAPPARAWVDLDDVTLSQYSEGKIEDGGVPPIDDKDKGNNDNNNNNNDNNNNSGGEVVQEAGLSKLVPLVILGGLAYAVFKD